MASIRNLVLALTLAASPLTAIADRAALKIECKLVLSPDSAFEERWAHTPAKAGVHLPQTHSVVRKQYFAAVLFLTSFPADEQVLQYDIRLTKPDGGIYFEQKNLDGFNIGKASQGSVLCSRARLKACFEPEDALGVYVASVVIHDEHGKPATTAKESIELKEYVQGKSFESQDDLSHWVLDYHEKQEPARVIPAFLEIGEGDDRVHEAPFTIGFFDEAFRRNAWLFPLLLEKYAGANPRTREKLLQLLARSNYDASAFVAKLSDADRAGWDKLRAESCWKPLSDPIASRDHVNELWGMYLASGGFAPIYRMCEALSPEETGAVANGNARATNGAEAPLRKVVPLAVGKELAEVASYDELVAQYCEWIVEDEKTPKGVRKDLSELLETK